eukprot:136766_1
MAFVALISLTYSLFGAINQATSPPTLNDCNLWTSTDYFYRAPAVTNLRVIYYSKDHNNILNTQSLTGYCNHSIVYKEYDSFLLSLFGVPRLYLTGPPFSAINYMFPESHSNNYSLFNGDGDTFYDQW